MFGWIMIDVRFESFEMVPSDEPLRTAAPFYVVFFIIILTRLAPSLPLERFLVVFVI